MGPVAFVGTDLYSQLLLTSGREQGGASVPGPVYDAMHKAPVAALDWLALKGRTAHWLR